LRPGILAVGGDRTCLVTVGFRAKKK
jgi:hypothetical protein